MLICSRCHQEECVCELGVCLFFSASLTGCVGRGAPAEEKPTLVDEKTPVKPITILSILQDAPRKKGVINVKPSSKLAQRGREVGQAIASQEPPVSLTSGLADVASSYHSDDTPELKGTDFNDVFSVDRRPFQSLAARPKRKARPPTPTPEDNPKKLRPRVCSCYIPVHGSVVCATCGFLRKEHRSEACDFFTPSESGLTCIVCDQPKRHHFGDA